MSEVISREEARAEGLTRYFTGKPCKHGHVAERHVASCGCMVCRREIKERDPYHAARGRDSWRRFTARQRGHAPAPRERDCPPRPKDRRCQLCHRRVKGPFDMHHDHDIGVFIAWTCRSCNGNIERPLEFWITDAYRLAARAAA
jgi:hypothetical protein